MNVLIVDDDRTVLSLLGDLLTDLGHDVVKTAGGADAIRAAAKHAPDVVFLDFLMPRMSGLEVLKAIRRQESRRSYVVFLTAMSEPTIEQMPGAHRADAFVSKPFSKATIVQTMANARAKRQRAAVKTER